MGEPSQKKFLTFTKLKIFKKEKKKEKRKKKEKICLGFQLQGIFLLSLNFSVIFYNPPKPNK
jgi:hypothetical protein